jgi:hypothetical protein
VTRLNLRDSAELREYHSWLRAFGLSEDHGKWQVATPPEAA